MMKKDLQLNRGYTLLFAVLVASVVLAIGISILNISKKEFLLSASARESTSAFYAADSGLECAVYFSDNFATSSIGVANASVDCIKQQLSYAAGTIQYESLGENNKEGRFTFDLKMPNGNACAIVTAKLFYQDHPVLGYVPRTTIESRGYNIGWDGTNCSQASPKRVERALRYTF